METRDNLRGLVRDAYSAAAEQPEARHPFPAGTGFALSVGYPADLLDSLPAGSHAAFAGVSNVAIGAPIAEGMTVADIGCGAGLDSLISARRGARVLAFDFSPAMLSRAAASARELRETRCLFAQADAEALPLPDASVQMALINGILNLNGSRAAILREIARILAPGGRLFGAELILQQALPAQIRASRENWFS